MDQQKQTRSFSKFRLYLSFLIGILVSIIVGICVFHEFTPDGDSDEKIEKIKTQIGVLSFRIHRGEEITWDQLNGFGHEIDSTNRDTAIATVMMEFPEPPKAFTGLDSRILSSIIWVKRVELSQKKWKMYKLSDHYIKCILIGAGSIILTIPGVWIFLGWTVLIFRSIWRWAKIVLRFIWDFLLDRVTEISNAIKCKKETRSKV